MSLINGFTRYIQLHPVVDKRTNTVTKVLLDHWVAKMGNPDVIVTDDGKEFTGEVFQRALAGRGIVHKLIPPGEKQQNLVERLHGTVWTMLRSIRAVGVSDNKYWLRWVKEVQLAYNARIHRSTQQAPAMALRGWNPKLTLGQCYLWKPT